MNDTNKSPLDTENVFELAMILGKALKKDPRMIRMENARKSYEQDAALNTLMAEYEVQQKAIENVAQGEGFDAEMIDMIQNRMDELYTQITKHPVFIELNAAQEDVNTLMNSVNNTIMFAITGEMPSGCTHDCSTCGGGCH